MITKRRLGLTLGLLVILAAAGRAGTLTWTGLAGDGLASTAGNWDENRVPTDADAIVLDGSSHSNLTWDANAVHTVTSWTQIENYTGTVTIMTVYDAQAAGYGDFTNFTISGDCVISNGV